MKHAKEPTIYPGVDTIRRIQQLLVLCSLLPPDGRLCEGLRKALTLSAGRLREEVGPPAGLHPFETDSWLNSMWIRADLSPGERELVAWQNDSDNMGLSMGELLDVEERIGVRLVADTFPGVPDVSLSMMGIGRKT